MNQTTVMVRATVAGGVAGALAAAVLAVLGLALMARLAPRLMPRMMAGAMGRMMREGGCSERMRACMESFGRMPGEGAESS